MGALFNEQSTKLALSGLSNTLEIGDEKIYDDHGYVAYNLGEPDAKVRPYLLGGVGATQFGSVTTVNGRNIGGTTKFSSTWGLGLKLYPSRSFGIRMEGRWTPTCIKSDATGYWCDPYWGCYVTGDARYANQFELSGGISLRF